MVRLPEEVRFEVDEVCVKRVGRAVLLFPKDAAWTLMGEALGQVDDDFMPERQPPERAGRRNAL